MSEFVSTRCIRCGSPASGSGQYCQNCVEQKRAEEAERAQRVAQAIADRPAPQSTTGTLCPACGMWASKDARFCGYCRFQFGAMPGRLQQMEYAGFWIRLVAFIIDGFILGAIGFVIGAAVTNIWEAFLLQLLARAVYCIAFWVGPGATPGKMVMGIKVVMTNGEPIELGAACLRYVGYWFSGLILGIGYLMIAFSSEKKGLHDNIANTVVINSR
jgi:uncharacterized RDD family membrane protein YckC